MANPTTPIKRGPGRPRKQPAPVLDANANMLAVDDYVHLSPASLDEFPEMAGRVGQLETIEPADTRQDRVSHVDVQFPALNGSEPRFYTFRADEVVKMAPPAADAPAAAPAAHALQYVPLALIDVLSNTRTHYDEAALEELTASIRQYGVMQNVLLRPHPEQPGRYQLAAGHRRYLAATRAELQQLPAAIRSMSDHEFLEIQTLENLQREALNPADEAQAFAMLLANEFTAEEIGLRIGKNAAFVAQRASLAKLVPELEKLLRSGRLHVGAALLLARHPELVQQKIVQEQVNSSYETATTLSMARLWVQRHLRELSRAPFSLTDPDLNPVMGACTGCPQRTSAQTLLFPELAESDCCLNEACYSTKIAAHIERVTASIALEHGKAPMRLSYCHFPDDKKLISRNQYKEVEPDTPGAVPGIYIDQREGEVVYVKLTGSAGEESPEAKAAKKAEAAAHMRVNRLKRLTNELLAEQLRDRFTAGLEQNGDDARQLLVHFAARAITYGVSKAANTTVEYLVQRYGFDQPAGPDLNTQYRSNEPTLHEQYLRRQLARLDVSVLVVLYFDLKFRERMHDEQYQTQHVLAKHLPGGVPDVAAEAEQLLLLRFYSKGPKSASAEALTDVLNAVMGEEGADA